MWQVPIWDPLSLWRDSDPWKNFLASTPIWPLGRLIHLNPPTRSARCDFIDLVFLGIKKGRPKPSFFVSIKRVEKSWKKSLQSFNSKSAEKSCLITLIKIRILTVPKNTHKWVFFDFKKCKFSTFYNYFMLRFTFFKNFIMPMLNLIFENLLFQFWPR